MKTVLVWPPEPTGVVNGHDYLAKTPPLGLEALASEVQDFASVNIIDCRGKNVDEQQLAAAIRTLSPDFIGITVPTVTLNNPALKIAKLIRENFKTAKILAGGIHATFVDEQLLNSGNIDIVVRGEGEKSFREILRQNKDLADIKGLSYLENGTVKRTGRGEVYENLDDLKIPDSAPMPNPYTFFGLKTRSLETSRGCPHKCIYCCISAFYERMWRAKTPARVLREIELTLARYPDTEAIFFPDDNATCSPARIREILKGIAGRNLDCRLILQSRVDTLQRHPDIVELLALANTMCVFLGIESPVEETHKFMNKKSPADQTREVIRHLKQNDVGVIGAFIIGFPHETKEMIQQTIEFALDLNVEVMHMSYATPLPGTQWHKQLANKKALQDIDWNSFHWQRSVLNLPVSDVELENLRRDAYKRFAFSGAYVDFTRKAESSRVQLVRRYIFNHGIGYILKDVCAPRDNVDLINMLSYLKGLLNVSLGLNPLDYSGFLNFRFAEGPLCIELKNGFIRKLSDIIEDDKAVAVAMDDFVDYFLLAEFDTKSDRFKTSFRQAARSLGDSALVLYQELQNRWSFSALSKVFEANPAVLDRII